MIHDPLSIKLAHQRVSARIADKYLSQQGEARDAAATKERQAQEVGEIERALDTARRGLSAGLKGDAGRIAIKRIETILVRDYGL